MTKLAHQERRVLYVVVCAAGPASQVQEFVTLAQAANWDVFVIPTPHAVPFLDIPLLARLTGHQVRSDYRSPETAESFPPCDAIVVVAATFNTINKFALGLADNCALTILCENLGRERPILIVPCVNQNHLARHPVFLKNLETLRSYGMNVLYDVAKYPPRNEVPWDVVLGTLQQMMEGI